MAGADFLAALVTSCLRGAFPPVDLKASCLVRAFVCGRGCSDENLAQVHFLGRAKSSLHYKKSNFQDLGRKGVKMGKEENGNIPEK